VAVLLDPKNGSDRIATGATVENALAWSAYAWLRRASTVGGQMFSIGSADIDVYWSSSTTDRLTIDRRTSGTSGQWTVTAANDGITYSASQWVFIAVTQNDRGTPVVYTASPVQSVALGGRTVTVGNAGTGTALTGTSIAYLGNWSGFDYALGGDLAWFGFHNVVLTLAEIEEAMWRGVTLRGLVLASELESTSRLYDLSGNAHTLTNTGAADTADAGPPVTPLWLPTLDGWAQQVAPSGPIDTAGTQSMVVDATGASSLTGAITTTGAQTVAADATGASSLTGSHTTAGAQTVAADGTGASHLAHAAVQVAVVDASGASSVVLGPAGDSVVRVDATGVSELFSGPADVVTVGVQVVALDGTGTSSVAGVITTAAVALVALDGEGASFTSSAIATAPAPVADWLWELVAFDDERLAELVARGRRLRLDVEATPSASFGLDTFEALGYPDLVLGQVDLLVSRNGRPIFRGPIGGASGGDITLMGGALTFASTGIAELLADRYIPAGTELAALEAAQMAWQLIEDTQALGTLGILEGSLPDSVARTKTWDTPSPVLAAIRELAGLADGFEFGVEPDTTGAYRFDVWHPRRGADRGVVLEADRNVGSVSPTWDAGPGKIANDVTVAGVDQVAVTASDPVSAAAYRLRQRYLSLPDADEATTLGDRAEAELARDAQMRPSGTVRLLPGAPDANLDAIALGDVVTMDYAAGWARFEGPYRVRSIEVALPDAPSHEALTLTVEPAYG